MSRGWRRIGVYVRINSSVRNFWGLCVALRTVTLVENSKECFITNYKQLTCKMCRRTQPIIYCLNLSCLYVNEDTLTVPCVYSKCVHLKLKSCTGAAVWKSSYEGICEEMLQYVHSHSHTLEWKLFTGAVKHLTELSHFQIFTSSKLQKFFHLSSSCHRWGWSQPQLP